MQTLEVQILAVLAARELDSFITRREPSIEVELGGIPGDRHYGLLRPADSRQKFYPRNTMIANRRQLSLVSAEELRATALGLDIEDILPEWLGANVLLSGCPELTQLPQGARLLFPDGTGLICEGENLPCTGPGEVIAEALGREELSTRFVKAAKKKRGIVCSVEREGRISEGDAVRFLIP